MADKNKNAKVKRSFFKGVRAEWDKIVWTDKKTLGRQTVAVFVISVIVCLLITLADNVGLSFMEFIMR